LLGLVRAILDEGLENRDFINARVKNFDAFAKSLEPYTVERCAELCHIKPDQLRQAARQIAQSPNFLILYGREAMFAQQNDVAVARALIALLLITGHVGRANNGLVALYPHNNSTGAFDMGILPDGGVGRARVERRGLSAREMQAGKVRALYVMACDPAADGDFVKPEFLVVQDVFLTETAKLADVVLPAQSFAERDGTFTNTERRVQLFRAALKPVGESKPDSRLVDHRGNRQAIGCWFGDVELCNRRSRDGRDRGDGAALPRNDVRRARGKRQTAASARGAGESQQRTDVDCNGRVGKYFEWQSVGECGGA